MSSEFHSIEDLGGEDLTVSLINLMVFGETVAPYAVLFRVGNSRTGISLEDFCELCCDYLIRGGPGRWESVGGIPEPVRKVLELAAERIGR